MIDKITPRFLKQLDTFLRINHTWIWVTRIHLHVYFAIILAALFTGVALLYPMSLEDVPSMGDQAKFFGLMCIPAFAYLVFIIYQMSLFNVDKQYGKRKKYREFFESIIYIIAFMLPLLIPYSSSMLLSTRVNGMIDMDEVRSDYHQLIDGKAYHPGSRNDYDFFDNDSLYLEHLNDTVDDHDYEVEYLGEVVADDATQNKDVERRRILRDSIWDESGIFEEDRPYLYLKKHLSPTYTFKLMHGDSGATPHDKAYRELIVRVNIERDEAHATKHLKQAAAILDKYTSKKGHQIDVVLSDYLNHHYYKKKYYQQYDQGFGRAEANMDNLLRNASYDAACWSGGGFYAFVIAAFSLMLIFNIYKNVHWKQMLLAIASLTVLFTLVPVMDIISDAGGDLAQALGILIPIFFLISTFKGLQLKSFSWVHSQIAIILNLVLPFFPTVLFYYWADTTSFFTSETFDVYKIPYVDRYNHQSWRYSPEYYILKDLIWTCLFNGSLIFFLLIGNSFVKRLYLKYWSLPKRK